MVRSTSLSLSSTSTSSQSLIPCKRIVKSNNNIVINHSIQPNRCYFHQQQHLLAYSSISFIRRDNRLYHKNLSSQNQKISMNIKEQVQKFHFIRGGYDDNSGSNDNNNFSNSDRKINSRSQVKLESQNDNNNDVEIEGKKEEEKIVLPEIYLKNKVSCPSNEDPDTIQFLLVRHGQTNFNSVGRVQGLLDRSRLTKKGKEQAK